MKLWSHFKKGKRKKKKRKKKAQLSKMDYAQQQ